MLGIEQEVMLEAAEVKALLVLALHRKCCFFFLVLMATASLLGLLLWAVPVQLSGTCLRCWPDAAVYFSYDAYLLLGQDSAASDQLGKFFLGDVKELPSYGKGFLEREHMEREAGNLFHRLEQIIQKSKKNHEVMMKEAELERKDFIRRLEEASDLFVKEVCSFSCGQSRFQPYEVVQCRNCQILKASCYDLRICAGPNVAAAVLGTLAVLLVAVGAAVWYYRYCHRKKTEESESQDDEDEDDNDNDDDDNKDSSETSESSEKSEKSEEADAASPVANYPSSLEINIPSPPEFNSPNPPEFNIPSPPSF